MAHADIFRRIETNSNGDRQPVEASPAYESKVDKKALETIKLLGRQMIEMREIIDKQTEVIKTMKDEIINLKTKQTEQEGNIKLAVIDQRDIVKQLKSLKSSYKEESAFEDRRITGEDDIAKKFYRSYEESKVLNTEDKKALNQIYGQQTKMPAVFDISENTSGRGFSWKNMQKANPAPQPSTETKANEYIFGRIPKLLNLSDLFSVYLLDLQA